MPAVIRRARRGDERRVAEFAIKLFDQHAEYDPERFSTFANVEGAASFYGSRFDTPESVVVVAEIENEVVGFAYVERDELNYAELLKDGAWLHDIYVDEAARAEGVGKALIKTAADAAREMGAKKLLLTVAAKNAVAQQVFEKAGFRRTMVEMTLNLTDGSK
jgi:GNAT superfamily N-acetyltransferase